MGKTKQYTFLMDSGHGWLKVTKTELKKLSIADKISNYSYQRGAYAYLEEDGDAGVFIEALKTIGIEAKFKESCTDGNSRVRGYDGYENLTSEQENVLEDLKVRMKYCKSWDKATTNRIKNANLSTMNYWQGVYLF